ncbi:MAG: 23S rRNA (adenine(2503)-C(2))-methyltransferase RlmN [Phycisphaerales bacterium JB063]
MQDDRPYFFDQTPETLADLLGDWGMARFRSKQVMDWVYRKGIADPGQMANLSKADRDLLTQRMVFVRGAVLQHQRATDGTQKLLVDWSLDSSTIDGRDTCLPIGAGGGGSALRVLNNAAGSSDTQTECVMIPATSGDSGKRRKTACVSSQVGCAVGCKFCASGLGGLDGNLTAGQIVQQAWQLAQLPRVGRISNVVFMGMGEPLTNFRAVTQAARTLTAEWGMGISARKVTISTVGVPNMIKRLAEQDLGVTLAISLHAPNDAIRKQIIPWAEFVSIEQLIEAGRYYFDKTGREVTLEYILLSGVNDQPEHAHELAEVSRRLRSNINLIRYNEVAGLPFGRPLHDDVHHFQRILRDAGRVVHLRASRGRDIAAACGQLRHEQAGV